MDRCLRLEARNATRQELLWLHDPKYLDKMEGTLTMTQSALIPLENEVPTHFPGNLSQFERKYIHSKLRNDNNRWYSIE